MEIEWDALRAVLMARPQVSAAWVFGSAQSGTVREGSDLDIGLLLSAPLSLDELADLRADIQRALQIDDIDLLPLNRASATLRFEALCGRLLFYRDPDRFAGFFSLTAREYEDSMALLQRFMAAWRPPVA